MKTIATLKIEKMGNLGVKNTAHLGNYRQTSLFSCSNAFLTQIGIYSLTQKSCVSGHFFTALRGCIAARHLRQ